MKKTKDEQELGRQKDKEIDRLAAHTHTHTYVRIYTLYLSTLRLSQEIDELSEVVSRQKERIKRYSVYQKFMERVAEYTVEVCMCACVCVCVFLRSDW